MRKISLISVLLACFILSACLDVVRPPAAEQLPSPAKDSVQTNKDEDKVVKYFDDRQIIPQEVIDPSSLPECLLIKEKQGDKYVYFWTKVVSSRPDPKPEFKNEIIYESIVDKSFAAKANYLTVTGSLGAEDKVELVIEDVYISKGAPFTDPAIKTAAETFVNSDPKKTSRTYFYVQNVKYTTIKYKVFKKVDRAVQFTGIGFGADGKVYASNSNYSLQKIVSINTFPLEPEPKPPKSFHTGKGHKVQTFNQLEPVAEPKKLPSVIKDLHELK